MNNSILDISLLYVEDEPETNKSTSGMLSRRVTTFYSAHNGADALKIYIEYKPDLVLSDIKMSKMNGLELIDKIKKINPKVRSIITTAHTDTSYLLKSIELQVDGFVVKPIRKDTLIATIKKQAEIILLEKLNVEQKKKLEISEEKYRLLTEAIKQQNIELKERNSELDAFSHTVAHDLKNPLGTIMGFANLLYEDYGHLTKDEFESYLGTIIKSGNKTQQIINNLLLFASVRKQKIKYEHFDMGFVVSEAINNYKQKITNHNAQIKLPQNWPTVSGNVLWIEEVWSNYISNALKYGGNPPIIEIGYDYGKNQKQEDIVRFWISDNGNGVSMDDQKLVFKNFERLNQTKIKGHGLGLPIVQRIIVKLGGEVGVESNDGEGSLFYFTLPHKNIQVTSNPDTKKVEKAVSSVKLKILIAEDESTSDTFLKVIVKNISREILHAKTGDEAVKIFQSNPDIDLILMDIRMPVMDGYDATRRIRMLDEDVRIIAQTAYALHGDREKAIEAGCNDYITKPINKEMLLQIIHLLFPEIQF